MTAASPVMPTYAPQPVAFERGDGAWLYDTDGRRYLDLLAGIAVNTLGHNHPRLVAAIADQAYRPTGRAQAQAIAPLALGNAIAGPHKGCRFSGIKHHAVALGSHHPERLIGAS